MNVHDARSLFIQELHSYLVAHYSNTPKLAITMDCTGRIADVVLYIHCTNDQWNIVAINLDRTDKDEGQRMVLVLTRLSEEEELSISDIKYYCICNETFDKTNHYIEELTKYIF